MKKEIEGVVDITQKKVVLRSAVATGMLKLSQKSLDAISSNQVKKGNVIEASTIAAIQAVKETPRIIPHCHPIPLEGCKVDWELLENALHCTVSVTAHYKTGIEMEAITGVCAGLLCALDMVKSHEKDADGQYPNSEICQLRIVEKYKSE
ncbi:MAG: cyclic pyranopterin monophosphate synthase MoaC [Candidatus Poseidoniaceae archaeon]|nr:cyclic pyranopterin monophosphate synthase MoaC [Candidatus Poseidoniaceae archaeon]